MVYLCELRVMCFSRDYTDLFLTLSDAKIQTAEHILITDLSQSSGDALICWSIGAQGSFGWYHQFIKNGKNSEIPLNTTYYGWNSKINPQPESGYTKLMLLIDTVPIEGIFTCSVGTTRSVYVEIHYPSKIFLSF